ncbi:MAG TPA: hypothetical protein PL105_18945, partial [Caldilineaceae bacterium]|nr:hypothetical protein [Caldilineaceae bacterium]
KTSDNTLNFVLAHSSRTGGSRQKERECGSYRTPSLFVRVICTDFTSVNQSFQRHQRPILGQYYRLKKVAC